MKKGYLSFLLLLLCATTFAQQTAGKKKGFDKVAALQKAQQKFPSNLVAQKEYMAYLQKEYMRELAHKSTVVNANQPYSYSYDEQSKTIDIDLTPQNANCPDFSFENMNFGNWQGDTWTLSGTSWTATPTWAPGMVTLGTNNPAQPVLGFATPTQHRMTIMTTPPTVNNPPANCIGWDSIAIDPTTHLSDVPFVPPFAGGVTCRLGNANTGGETERLRYTLAVTAANSQITLAYAVVLEDPGHPQVDQPFFQMNLYDQNGNPIPGCGNYQVDAFLAATDTSFKKASVWQTGSWLDPSNSNWTFYARYYKKWTMVGVDLTPYIGQNITIECRTADCSYFGHYGYAYIDASCGASVVQVNMCPGSPNQEAIGPPGYVSYQWYGPNSTTNAVPPPVGTNDTLTVMSGNIGDVYYLTAISANGCTTQMQAILQVSTVGVSQTSSTPSCPGGNSGTANVVPTGSPGPYSYVWQNSSGVTVSTTNPATGLSPGTYSVNVSAVGCGQKDTVVTVGIAPPTVQTATQSFCGTAAYLVVPAGSSNIQWYDASGAAVPAPQGNNDTLLAANVANGQIYAVTYLNSGCFDSLRITMNAVPGGTLSHTKQNTCVGQSNGQATVNLSTTSAGPFNYTMSGPGLNQTYTGVTQTSYTLSNLAFGTYTVNAFDGMCFYADVFTIDTISVAVYINVAPTSICYGDSAFINYTFGGGAPAQCQVSSSTCTSPQPLFVGPANNQNTSTTYPTPFGNWYTYMKAQYIYTAAELSAAGISAGKISSITFNCTQLNGATVYPNFNIGIGCTSLSTFPSAATENDLLPGTVNVYSNASYSVVLGANTFNFSQGYEWDGVSNLIVEICFEFPGPSNWTNNCVVACTTSPSYPSISVLSDTDPICAGLVPTGFYFALTDQMRPTATFGWCSSVASPSMFTYNLTPTTGLAGTISPPNPTILQPISTTNYTFTTTSIAGGCTKQDMFTVTVITPFTVNMPPPASFCTSSGTQNIVATFTDFNTGAPAQPPATWAGNGISNNNGFGSATFDPALAGPGTHTLVLTAGTSCLVFDTVVYTVNPFQSATLQPIGPFCVYDGAVQILAASSGGTWYGPVTGAGTFNPGMAGVTSNLTPPYHSIKYVTNAGTPCPDSSTIQVEVFARPLVDFTTDTTEGCEPDVPIQFTPVVSPPGGTFVWNFGNGTTSTGASPGNQYSIPGTYSPKLTYTDPNGCVDDTLKSALISVHPRPNADFYSNPGNTTILEPHIYFVNTSNGATDYLWDIAGFMQTTVENPDYEFADPGLYQITLWVTNQFDCSDSAMLMLDIDPDHVIYIPNAFTPNFDGKNDIFQAEAFGIYETESFRMMIFDRWGNKMFEASDINDGWDGTKNGDMLQEDIFVYLVEYKDISGKQRKKTGSVSLIR